MKRYIVFAGVNGAGKTTLYQTNPDIHTMARVNLDEIVREYGSWKNYNDVATAGRKAVTLINQYLSEGVSFNQETTLCGKSILNIIKRAKALQYRVELYYVGLNSPELAKERVLQRMKAGGHGVSDLDIDRRYYESIDNLKKILPQCDYAELYDNTESFRLIASFGFGECIDRDSQIPIWCNGLVNS